MFAQILLLALQATQTAAVPPCKSGASTCDPWERAWPSSEERNTGPFNLIIRWGGGSPIAVHYDSMKRCQMAADELRLYGARVAGDGHRTEPADDVAISSVCIPG